MGRGQGQPGNLTAASVLGLGPKKRASDSINSGINKDLGKRQTFMKDRTAWRKQEKARIKDILEELSRATKEFAASDENWNRYLLEYAEAPAYSPMNMIWARSQLRAKGVEESGDIFSESVWKKLGRRPKAEFARNFTKPEKKRDSKYGFDPNREWSDKYCVEMLAPMMIEVEKKDPKTGEAMLDENGKKIKKLIPLKTATGEMAYRSFVGYHINATEPINGKESGPIPDSPWVGATGSPEDAKSLLQDLQKKVIPGQNLSLEAGENSNGAVAKLSADGKKITLDPSASEIEQANALLGEICKSVASRKERNKNENLEDYNKKQDLIITSAQHVLASLYKIDNKKQVFPHLHAFRNDTKTLKQVSNSIHNVVGNILADFDPSTRARKMQHSA